MSKSLVRLIHASSHDCSEIRTGDVNYISRLYTKRNEPEAVQDTFGGTELHDLIEPLFHEAEAKESVCAKIVVRMLTIWM